MGPSLFPSSKAALKRRVFTSDTVIDVMISCLSPIAAFWLRDPGILTQDSHLNVLLYATVAACSSALFLVHFGVARGFSQFFSLHDAVQIAKASACSSTATAATVFSLARLDDLPRSIPALQFIIMTGALIGMRLILRIYSYCFVLREAPRISHDSERHVVIVGANQLAWFYIRLLDTFASGNRKIAAVLDEDKSFHGRSIYGHTVMGGIEDAATLLDDFAQHGVLISGFVICERRRDRARGLFQKLEPLCSERGLGLEIAAETLGVYATHPDFASDNLTIAEMDDKARLARESYLRIKRPIESVLAAGMLVALLPVAALVAGAVAVSMGFPVIFWQRRVGKDGRPIFLYKFKTMRNPVDGEGRRLDARERETPVGTFLRVIRVDEIPQLYNVVKGEMALIGPRPLLPVDQPNGVSLRLSVPPGLTGWAQIHGGQMVTVDEKNALDEWYVRNATLALDLFILFRTFFVVLMFEGDCRDEERLARALAQTDLASDARRETAQEARDAESQSGDTSILLS
jgi:lipopolysaccharide/colanic/teichoic acid biosynthesis glycosyltransferase